MEIAALLLHALAWMASHNVMHRDVKPDNILVDDNVVAKLADFGESTRFDRKAALKSSAVENDALTMTMVGTKLYCAPEVMVGDRYNESAASIACVRILSP